MARCLSELRNDGKRIIITLQQPRSLFANLPGTVEITWTEMRERKSRKHEVDVFFFAMKKCLREMRMKRVSKKAYRHEREKSCGSERVKEFQNTLLVIPIHLWNHISDTLLVIQLHCLHFQSIIHVHCKQNSIHSFH